MDYWLEKPFLSTVYTYSIISERSWIIDLWSRCRQWNLWKREHYNVTPKVYRKQVANRCNLPRMCLRCFSLTHTLRHRIYSIVYHLNRVYENDHTFTTQNWFTFKSSESDSIIVCCVNMDCSLLSEKCYLTFLVLCFHCLKKLLVTAKKWNIVYVKTTL